MVYVTDVRWLTATVAEPMMFLPLRLNASITILLGRQLCYPLSSGSRLHGQSCLLVASFKSSHINIWYSPNCYTYPYDDMSSTFTCTKEVNNYNTQNYTITLCPNGVSWGGTGGSTGTPTSTSTSSSPTGTAGTCSGTSYSSSQVCDSGHICPSGQYYCNGSCYSPSTSCCSSNAIISNSGTCSCNGQGFAGSSYVCDAGALCPAGTYTCGGACYSPASYGCCNGALTAAGKGC